MRLEGSEQRFLMARCVQCESARNASGIRRCCTPLGLECPYAHQLITQRGDAWKLLGERSLKRLDLWRPQPTKPDAQQTA